MPSEITINTHELLQVLDALQLILQLVIGVAIIYLWNR